MTKRQETEGGAVDCVTELLPEHRAKPWRDRFGRGWSWSRDREMWLDESRGEADRAAWHTQESMANSARMHGPYVAVDPNL
ncbi:Uncharacterised protein [Mycobacteroides abscessus subsp. abscessus]|jgi:hypothetical protein|uniref:hypothetical protein n=1 Tax=Mycobacteroides abscessus TaxID=36809 RepID=UPI00092B1743|nr:hypothetical protein [Mycobacteroides abscessus]SIH26240.1 Uncharacterised protein [Mycobacteroides abscessus subsp. abscessus]